VYSYSTNRTGDLVDFATRTEQRLHDMRVKSLRANLEGTGTADCRGCGEPIPEERRKAVPNATKCACCQSADEHLQKMQGYSGTALVDDPLPNGP
jgi:phage/conjugal plasmid C-4 type zinc finger TraR family protein